MSALRHDYQLRAADGLLIMTMDNAAAGALIRKVRGKWRPYTTENYSGTCFEFTESMVSRMFSHDIYLWAGYLLIENH